jgi:hypothetical protein
MNDRARQEIFEDLDQAYDESKREPWKPFSRNFNIKKTPLENMGKQTYKKRGRGGGIDPHESNNTLEGKTASVTTNYTETSKARNITTYVENHSWSSVATNNTMPQQIGISSMDDMTPITNPKDNENHERLNTIENDMKDIKEQIKIQLDNLTKETNKNTDERINILNSTINNVQEELLNTKNTIKETIALNIRDELQSHNDANNAKLESIFGKLLEKQETRINTSIEGQLSNNNETQNKHLEQKLKEQEERNNNKLNTRFEKNYKDMTKTVENIVHSMMGKQHKYKTRLTTKYANIINKKLGLSCMEDTDDELSLGDQMDHEIESNMSNQENPSEAPAIATKKLN